MEISKIIPDLDIQNNSVDLHQLFQTFRRRLGLFLSTLILVSSLVTLITLQIKPKYTATASVMINLASRNLFDIESVITGNAPNPGAIDTEVEIIKSRVLVDRIVSKLDLTKDPEFNPDLREPGAGEFIKSRLKTLFPQSIVDRPDSRAIQKIDKDQVSSNLLEGLRVQRLGDTYVLNVIFESYDPEKSALIANAFADNYLLEQLESKFESTSRANEWLNVRLEELRNEVRSAENLVETYRTNSGLLSARGSSLTEQQISDLNAQQIIQTSAYNEVKSRLESVRAQVARGVPADSIAEVMNSAVIQGLRRQQAEVAGRKAELSSRYGARHPDVLKVDREAADIQVQIRQEIARIISNLESEAGIAETKVQTIESGLSRLRSELSSNNRSLVRLRELEREAEVSRALYQNFLEQFKQNNDQEKITEADARVISHAIIPSTHSSPKTMFNVVFGILLGILSGIGMVTLVEMLDRGLTTGEEVESELKVPFIASIPELNIGIIGLINRLFGKLVPVDNYIVEKPLSLFSESFRTLRSTILLSSPGDPPKVIAIASALPNEGKTTIATSIGRLSAMSGSRTVIIDCDLRLRKLSIASKFTPKAGLVKYLLGDAPLKDIIVTDESTNCDYILNTNDGFTHKDIFGSAAFSKLLTALKKRYDFIVLDTAPLLLVAETRTLTNKADCVIVATRWRRTSTNAVKAAVDILKKVDANILGVALTRVNLSKRAKYGVGDFSYYAREYGSYYAELPKDNET